MDIDEIIAIYKKAYQIVKNNRVLWIFGMILVLFAGGGSSFNPGSSGSNSSSSSSSLSKIPEKAVANPLFTYFKELFFSLPVSLFIGLGIGILLLILIGMMIRVILGAWAKGAAIAAINEAYDEKEVTLTKGSEAGINNLKNMVWLIYIPWLIYFLIILLGTIIVGVSFLLLNNGILIAFPIILTIIFVLGVIILSMVISASQLWGERIVVLEGKSGKEAFYLGWHMVKKYVFRMTSLGCANCLTNCLVGCCLGIIIIGGVFALVVFGIGMLVVNLGLGISVLSIAGILVLAILTVSSLIGGILKIFNYTTWNILFRQIKEGEKNAVK